MYMYPRFVQSELHWLFLFTIRVAGIRDRRGRQGINSYRCRCTVTASTTSETVRYGVGAPNTSCKIDCAR